MTAVDFEYAIKKDVRNNPIVREVDEARQRQLWRSFAIGGVLVLVILFSAWQNFELVRHGYKVQELKTMIEEEQAINRQLRLEVEMLRSPERIEKLANQLDLVPPAKGQSIVLERVAPSPRPDASVVAAR